MRLHIDLWEWDEANLDHLARHGITLELVEDEIWTEAPKYNKNLPGRSASHFMIGPDRGGTMWTICILQVGEAPAIWRAITGWESKSHEKAWYRRAR